MVSSPPPQASTPDPPVGGSVALGWESIAETFRANFRPTEGDPGDLGAALCVIANGETVVDLWGGWADRARSQSWRPDTLVNSYSVGKGVTAAVALAAISKGLIDLDSPAAFHWPELVTPATIREVMSHQAGVPAIRGDAPADLPTDWSAMCAALASTEPWWQPGTGHGYHVNTFGFLVGEPVRRAAGAVRFGDLLRGWLADPIDADLWFGVSDRDLARCSEVDLGSGPLDDSATGGGATVEEFTSDEQLMIHHAYFNPPTLSGMGVVETRSWRQAEVPSTNGHFTAKGVAKVYASLLNPSGPVAPAVLKEAVTAQVDGPDRILGSRTRFGLGFQLHQDERPIGVTPASFGHFGYGGSVGFADPDARLAVSYLINRPGDRWQIPRTRRLLAALRQVIGA